MECLECGLGYVTVVGEDGFKLYPSCEESTLKIHLSCGRGCVAPISELSNDPKIVNHPLPYLIRVQLSTKLTPCFHAKNEFDILNLHQARCINLILDIVNMIDSIHQPY